MRLVPGLLVAALVGSSGHAAAADDRAAQEARCRAGAADACRLAGQALSLSTAAADQRLGAAQLALACELGDAPACAGLGALRAIGRGVAYDAGRATALSRRACDAGVALGCANLAVLTVEEAGGLAPGKAPLGVLPRLRVACESGVAEACLDLAAALDLGASPGGQRDREGAAAALRRGCDLDLGIACHRLALLLSPPDPRAGGGPAVAFAPELSAKACRAAVAPACEAARLPVPAAGPRTPSPRLVADPRALALAFPGGGGLHPADLAARSEPERTAPGALVPSAEALAAAPAALHARLGLERGEGAPGPGPDAALALLLPLRRLELFPCLEAPRSSPGAGARLAVAFVVEPDGRAGEVRAAAEPAEPEAEACAARIAEGWEFPIADRTLGPLVVAVDLEPLPGGQTPAYPGPAGLRPAPEEPDCLRAGGAGRAVTLKLAVDVEGRPALVHPISAAPEPLVAAAAERVRACRWRPGAGDDGRPALLWTTVTVPVGSR